MHTSPELKAQAEELGIPVLDCDGIAEVWVDSIEDWKSVVTDPDFVRTIARKCATILATCMELME